MVLDLRLGRGQLSGGSQPISTRHLEQGYSLSSDMLLSSSRGQTPIRLGGFLDEANATCYDDIDHRSMD